jgi:hypothetical protein
MIYLFLSILFSTAISLIFKLLSHWKADNVQAIFWNYCTCVVCGILLNSNQASHYLREEWSVIAILSGILFIVVFLMMAKTAQEYGVSVSVVSSKMAVIFPIIFGLVVAGETMDFTTAIGILLSIISVWLVALSSGDAHRGHHFYIPLMVFIGSGLIDALLKFISWKFNSPDESAIAIHIFSGAAISGLIYLLLRRKPVSIANVGYGILLGVPNFFSIYFLLKAISDPSLPSVVMFPVNNIGVVLLGTVLSVWIWKEPMSRRKRLGILLAMVSILLISLQLTH